MTPEERQRRSYLRALKVIESALIPFFKKGAFGANVFEKGVDEIYFKRDYKVCEKLRKAVLHIKGRLDLSDP